MFREELLKFRLISLLDRSKKIRLSSGLFDEYFRMYKQDALRIIFIDFEKNIYI